MVEKTIAHHLEALPVEIYHSILDLTLTPGPSDQSIDTHYRPPSTLQLSRATRAKAAPAYYAQSRFHCADHVQCLKWLLALPRDHISLLREVRCESVSFAWNLDLFDYDVRMQSWYILEALRRHAVKLPEGVLRFEVRGDDEAAGCGRVRMI